MRCIGQCGTYHKMVSSKAHQLQWRLDHLSEGVQRDAFLVSGVRTSFPLSNTFPYLHHFTGGLMSRTTLPITSVRLDLISNFGYDGMGKHLISDDHGISNSPMLPEMNITPAFHNALPTTNNESEILHLPANSSGANVHKDLTRARFRSRLLYKVYLMPRIIESCDVCIARWFLVSSQYSELGMIQDFSRAIDLRISENNLCGHQ
jgi:hypothetical protein